MWWGNSYKYLTLTPDQATEDPGKSPQDPVEMARAVIAYELGTENENGATGRDLERGT
jgi:hypothetical protein